METTALGAAYLAGLYAGVYGSIGELREWRVGMTSFLPQMDDAARAEKLLAWEEALGRDMYRPRP